MLAAPRRVDVRTHFRFGAGRLAKQTVLLVDADPRSARVLEVSLRKAGYSVTRVQSAVEAIEAIEIAVPDLVLSDTRLAPPPGASSSQAGQIVDGYQLCRRLKDDPVWYSIPFIFLTSSSSIEDKIRGLELGVEDYLTKPIYIKEILTRIQLVLARKQREGMEGRTSKASFSGLLGEMGLVDLLTTIDLGRKSGVLDITGPNGKGVVFFRDGRVVDARCGRYTGAAAVYRMLVWNEGRFEIRFGPCAAEDVVDMSTQALLMEGMRRLDEWQRLQEQLPPLDAVYDVDVRELAARLGEIPDEVNQILKAFNGTRTLLEVVDESGFDDDLSALATLSKLYFEGLIVPAQTGTDQDETDEGSVVVPGPDDDKDHTLATLARTEEEPFLLPTRTQSVTMPATESFGEVGGAPVAQRSTGTVTAIVSDAEDGGHSVQNAVVSSDQDESSQDGHNASPAPKRVGEREERDVAKHRGKRRRSKREFRDEIGSGVRAAASTSAVPAVPTEATGAPVEKSTSVPVQPLQTPVEDTPRPEMHARAEANNVIQFPRSPMASGSGSHVDQGDQQGDSTDAVSVGLRDEQQEDGQEDGSETAPRETRTTLTNGTPFAVEKTTVGETALTRSQSAVETSTSVEKNPAVSASTPSSSEIQEDSAVQRSPSVPPNVSTAAPVEKELVASSQPSPEPTERHRKDSGNQEVQRRRERKNSFSGELSEEARAFFDDKSYELAYKVHHDTFEDLKPEETHEHTKNKRFMYITVGLVGLVVAVVGGLALYHKFFGVSEQVLPPVMPAASTASTTPPESTHSSGIVAHGGSTTHETPATTVTPPSATPEHPPQGETAATAPTASTEATVQTVATPTTSADAATTTAAATATSTDAATTATNAASSAPPNAPAASTAELLQAALRARARGNVTAAVAAYQAWLDAGGNDAGQVAQFAYWLANRGDLGRAAEWARRATTMDANNQLGWYVLGAALLEGPRRDRAGAREAFRRCAALAGRYAAECRAAM